MGSFQDYIPYSLPFFRFHVIILYKSSDDISTLSILLTRPLVSNSERDTAALSWSVSLATSSTVNSLYRNTGISRHNMLIPSAVLTDNGVQEWRKDFLGRFLQLLLHFLGRWGSASNWFSKVVEIWTYASALPHGMIALKTGCNVAKWTLQLRSNLKSWRKCSAQGIRELTHTLWHSRKDTIH